MQLEIHTEQLRLPEPPRSIKRLDLTGIRGAELLYIPVGYTQIALDNTTFPNLETVEVSPDNTSYSAQDGMLLSKDGTLLYLALAAGLRETLTLPETVTRLDYGAFAYTRCETIVFPNPDIIVPGGCFAHSQYAKTHDQIVVGDHFVCLLQDRERLELPDEIRVLNTNCLGSHRVGHLRCNARLCFPDVLSNSPTHCHLRTLSLGPKATVCLDNLDTYTQLESISVDSRNPWISSKDGVLFSKNGKTLRFYPPHRPGTQYTLPAGTEKIAVHAFRHPMYLRQLTIPRGVRLQTGIFQKCTTLQEVTLGETNIPDRLFRDCKQLRRVHLSSGIHSVGQHAFFDTKLREMTLTAPVAPLGDSAFPAHGDFTLTVIDPKRRGLPRVLDAVWPRMRYMQLGRLRRSLTLRILYPGLQTFAPRQMFGQVRVYTRVFAVGKSFYMRV